MKELEIEITRRFYFSASHRYYLKDLSEEENIRLFGKNINPHGHNYILEVTLTGSVNERTGMIANLSEVKQWVQEILERYDHRYLNEDHPYFQTHQPTTEELAKILFLEIEEKIPPPARLSRIRVYETEDLFAEVEK